MARFLLVWTFLAAAAGEPADWIFSARYVLTMDAQRRVIDDGAVAIRGNRILAVGTQREIARGYQAKNTVHQPGGAIAPGFVNAHQHAPMSLFRGIADDRRLQDWLENFIFPAEAKNVTPEFVRWGTRLACAEMLLSGTTTYADMYYFEETIAAATKACGMRGVLGQTIIGFPAPDAKTPAEALKRAEAFIQAYRSDPLIVPAVAPHAVYTTPDDVLRGSRELADKYNVPLLIHLSETKRENDETRARRGMTPTRLLDMLGVLNGRTLAAHGVWIDDADMKLLKARNVGVAHCPSSNMMLASGVAPVGRYLAENVALGLGTDGFAGSNNDASMFEEMDLAAKLQKVSTMDPQALAARQALAMATIGGARALGMEKEIGSLEPGKRADLMVVSLGGTHARPLYSVESQMVYAVKASDVRHVMVDGRMVVRDRRVVGVDEARLREKVLAYRDAIARSVKKGR